MGHPHPVSDWLDIGPVGSSWQGLTPASSPGEEGNPWGTGWPEMYKTDSPILTKFSCSDAADAQM